MMFLYILFPKNYPIASKKVGIYYSAMFQYKNRGPIFLKQTTNIFSILS